jgi:hypothetical protein
VLLALLAIALPAQTNFEHQNLNTVLLGATGAGAYALVRGRDALGGGLIGMAAALKAFPALLLIHLACAGKWKATSVGVATAAFLTALPIAWYGVDGGLAALGDWLRLNQEGGWPTRFQNQSLFAAAARLSQEAAMPVLFLGAAVLVGLTAWVASTRVGRTTGLAGGLALALAVAVLVSPIAWDHYWVLLFPTFLWVAGDAMRSGDDGRRGSWLTFGAAAILVSGLSPVFGAGVFNAARAFSSYTLAGLLLVGWSVSALIGGHSSHRER